MNKEKTYGIIFYKYINDKFYLYLRKNTKDYHEDFIIKDNNLIIQLSGLPILNKSLNIENNHLVFLLNKDKNNEIFEKIQKYEKIEYKKFISMPFVNNLKHKRLKYFDLDNSIKIIRNNYIIRNLL